MPENLMRHIEKQVGPDGLYTNAGEFLRDLVRKDVQAEQFTEKNLDRIWGFLMPGVEADEKEFEPLSVQDVLDKHRLS